MLQTTLKRAPACSGCIRTHTHTRTHTNTAQCRNETMPGLPNYTATRAATYCSTLQHIRDSMQGEVDMTCVQTDTLQRATTRCNTRPHTATGCNIQKTACRVGQRCHVSTPTHCTQGNNQTQPRLQNHTATHYSTMQHTATHCIPTKTHCNTQKTACKARQRVRGSRATHCLRWMNQTRFRVPKHNHHKLLLPRRQVIYTCI